ERLLLRIPGSVRLLDGRGPRLLIARDEFRVCVYGRAPGETRERDLSWMDWSLVDDLTPDGRRIVLTEQGGETGPNYAVCVRRTAGGPILRVGEGVGGSISPDGRWVVTLNRPQGHIVIVPIGAGQSRTLDPGDIAGIRWARWFPDGRRILFV